MIQDEIKKRILILDGAMGTAIQQYGLTEADFRGSEFISHPVNLKGNNDILNLTCPEVIRQIHRSYIEAGADIIETNTFNSNAISQAEYRGEKLVYRLNYAGAKLAVTEARAASHQVYVAGSMGPTSKTLSLSPDVNRPEFRPVDFDTLVSTYAEQVSGLIDGGVDLLLVETVFDGLNAKAAPLCHYPGTGRKKDFTPCHVIGHHQRQKWADAHRTESGSTLHHCIPLPAVQFRIELFVRGHRLIAVYRTLIQDAALSVEYLS